MTVTYNDKYSNVERSGVKKVEYCCRDINAFPSNQSDCIDTDSTISGLTGTYYLFTRAEDNAGNVSSYKKVGFHYLLDNVTPYIDSIPQTSEWVTASSYINVVFKDDNSGVERVLYTYCWREVGESCTLSGLVVNTSPSPDQGVSQNIYFRHIFLLQL